MMNFVSNFRAFLMGHTNFIHRSLILRKFPKNLKKIVFTNFGYFYMAKNTAKNTKYVQRLINK